MDKIKLIPNILSIFTLLGAVVPILKIVVNAFTAHELDKFFKTSWKKFIETTILILMSSFLITVAMYSKIDKGDEFWSLDKDKMIYFLLALYLLVIIIITLAIYPLNELVKICCNRNYYYIKELGEKWMIEISEDRGRYFLSHDDRNKVVTSLDNIEIFRELKQTEQGTKLYSKLVNYCYLKKTIKVVLIILLVFVVGSLILLIVFNQFLYFSLFAIFAYLLVLIAIFLSGWNDYENSQQNSQENSQENSHESQNRNVQ